LLSSAALLLILLAAGCAGSRPAPPPPPAPPPQNVFILLPDADGRVGKITVSNAGGSQTLDAPGQATAVQDAQSAPTTPAVLETAEVEALVGVALGAQPTAPVHFILYFEADSTNLTPASQADRSRIAEAIRERSSVDTSVVGHTDTRGDEKRNYELGLRRAQAVSALLAAAGVDPGMLDITSHGKTNLLVPTADNVAEPRNRRVEVTVR
jgi:outer membrane protein OmpA-like peptidoglycan-associated protein